MEVVYKSEKRFILEFGCGIIAHGISRDGISIIDYNYSPKIRFGDNRYAIPMSIENMWDDGGDLILEFKTDEDNRKSYPDVCIGSDELNGETLETMLGKVREFVDNNFLNIEEVC